VKPKPAQENWYRVVICLHEFGQRLVAPRLQILEIRRVIGAEPHHHGKEADLGGVLRRPVVTKFCTMMGTVFDQIIRLKFREALSPKKNGGAKTCKIWPDFGRLQSSTANISGTDEDIQNRTSIRFTAFSPAFGPVIT